MTNKDNKDRSAAAGLGTTAGTTVAEGAAVVALTGGSASASAITYALGLIGAPVVLGGAVYGISKAVKKRRGR